MGTEPASAYAPSVSANGAFVAFETTSPLVPSDTNGKSDVYLRNVTTGSVKRVSVPNGSGQSNGASSAAYVSATGRFVVFTSSATNLVSGDTNGKPDVFVRDVSAAKTYRVSVSSTGGQGNGTSDQARITPNGQYVVFISNSSNLVSGDTNHSYDVFLRNRSAHTTTRVSVSSSGAQANGGSDQPRITPDGRYVAFESGASNLVKNDTNGFGDVFVRDRSAHTTTRVSLSDTGAEGDGNSGIGAISSDGNIVAFVSNSTNFPDNDFGSYNVFVRDRAAHTTTIVSFSNGQATGGVTPTMSSDGRYVGYANGDIFVADRTAGTLSDVTPAYGGGLANGESRAPAMSPDGAWVAFESDATNLTGSPDTNGGTDVFLRGPLV